MYSYILYDSSHVYFTVLVAPSVRFPVNYIHVKHCVVMIKTY